MKASAATADGSYTSRLEAVLGRRDIQLKLEQFVVDAQERLLGERSQPAVLNQATVRTLVVAAFPSIRGADLAKVHAVRFDVPQSQVLFKGRETFAHRFWLYFLGAVVLLSVGLVMTDDRRSSVKLIGKWLVGITVAHLLVLWILPVVIVPAVTTNPWAHLVAASAGGGGDRDRPRRARDRRGRVLVGRPLHPGAPASPRVAARGSRLGRPASTGTDRGTRPSTSGSPRATRSPS